MQRDFDKLEQAWKIYETNAVFVRHFDFKPNGLIAIASVLSVAVATKFSGLAGAKQVIALYGWSTMAVVEASLLVISVACIFTAFLFIVASISPSASASFVGIFPWVHGKEDSRKRSLIYFGDITYYATHARGAGSPVDSGPWLTHFNGYTADELLADLADQVTENAVIASDKARNLRVASACLLVAMWLVLALIIVTPIAQLIRPTWHGLFQ